jgi:hypothetical protein
MIDWSMVFGSLVGAGGGSAIVQGSFNIWGEHRRRTAKATYLAMRLAVLLDAFGLACSEMINCNASAEPHPEHEYANWVGIPELPPYPDDSEGWVSLHRALAIRCLRLPGSVHASEGVLRATVEYAEDDYGDALFEQAARLGLEARRLAEDLHRRYGLDEAAGDYASSLEAALEKATKAMQDRRYVSVPRQRHRDAFAQPQDDADLKARAVGLSDT